MKELSNSSTSHLIAYFPPLAYERAVGQVIDVILTAMNIVIFHNKKE
jgi:hypothetical protein